MRETIALANDALSLRVSPDGGAVLDGFTRDGRPFLRPYRAAAFDAGAVACFPLVPIGNRVQGNACDFRGRRLTFRPNTPEPLYIHGDGWLGRWTVDLAGPTEVRLSFRQPAPDSSPHVFRATQAIRLDGARVRLDLVVENLGDALPFGIGFHPFFPRSTAVRVQAAARAWWSEGEDHLPVERQAIPADADFSEPRPLPPRWMNNGYEGWDGTARIEWPEARLAADLAADATFSRFMLYTPGPDADFFCLEPMSHAPNALAMAEPAGLHVLEPREVLAGGFTIAVSNLE